MGSFLISHRAVASTRTKVKPAGRRWDEVPNAPGGPHGGGKEWIPLCLWRSRWYHGSLSRSEAECLLTLCKECSYLVRTSQTNHSEYSLSLRSCQGFMHMKLTQCKDGKYVLGQNSPLFDTIP
ncbi:unnamed protein product, partial [Tetraodon nigroviridis]